MNAGTTKLGHQVALDPEKAAAAVLAAVKAAAGDLNEAAKRLGVGRTTLERVVRKLGVAERVRAAREACGWFQRQEVALRERKREIASRSRRKGRKLTKAHKARISAGVRSARGGKRP